MESKSLEIEMENIGGRWILELSWKIFRSGEQRSSPKVEAFVGRRAPGLLFKY